MKLRVAVLAALALAAEPAPAEPLAVPPIAVSLVEDPVVLRAARDQAEAPWLRLVARTAMLAVSPPGPAQARALAVARATLALWEPLVRGRVAELNRRLALAGQAQADRLLRPRLAAAGLPLRAPTRLIDACPGAALRPPVDGPALTSRAAAVLGREGGLTLAAEPGAPVHAPAAGRVAYAAPFRRYGRIVVIEHGHGWTTLLTGLATLAVRPGTAVALGAILGRVGSRDPLIGFELLHGGRPVDAAAMMARCPEYSGRTP